MKLKGASTLQQLVATSVHTGCECDLEEDLVVVAVCFILKGDKSQKRKRKC